MNVNDLLRQQIKELEQKTGIVLSEEGCHCGVNKIMPLWLRKRLSTSFNLSCIIHDIHHNSKIIDYVDADLIFLNNMKKQAGKSFKLKIVAYVFFMFVSLYTVYKNFRER